ncbi:MAG: Bro-N domain-containing protein [Planctomycetaceae bacterium]|nr:Bro-N domain-containing protein [Planctomycetaceae bacterium]
MRTLPFILSYRDTNDATKYLDADEVASYPDKSSGQVRHLVLVSEAGLYSLILRSRKPEAKAFKRWVTHEVLPAIRRTGGFGQPVNLQAVLDFLVEEREARIRFEQSLYERLVPTRGLQVVDRPPLAMVRARILEYVHRAGPDGLPRRVVSNRIRHSTEREMALYGLLKEGAIIEIRRNNKLYFILPQYLKREASHGI